MDFSAFASDEFDVVEWVDHVVKQSTQDSDKAGAENEAFLATQAMKLQLLSQDLNSSIAYSMSQLITLLPGATRGISQMQMKLDELQRSLKTVKADLDDTNSQFEGEANESIVQLEQLDTVKRNMTLCNDRLREAANWKRELREAQRALINPASSFTRSSLLSLSALFESLSRSQVVLRDMPGSEMRETTLASLKQKFKSVLDSHLRDSLRLLVSSEPVHSSSQMSSSKHSGGGAGVNEDVQDITAFVRIFEQLGWSSELHDVYAQAIIGARLDGLWQQHSANFSSAHGASHNSHSVKQRVSADSRALSNYLRGVLLAVRRECDGGVRRQFGTLTGSEGAEHAILRVAANLVSERVGHVLNAHLASSRGTAEEEIGALDRLLAYFDAVSAFAIGLLRRLKSSATSAALKRQLLLSLSSQFKFDAQETVNREIRRVSSHKLLLPNRSLLLVTILLMDYIADASSTTWLLWVCSVCCLFVLHYCFEADFSCVWQQEWIPCYRVEQLLVVIKQFTWMRSIAWSIVLQFSSEISNLAAPDFSY